MQHSQVKEAMDRVDNELEQSSHTEDYTRPTAVDVRRLEDEMRQQTGSNVLAVVQQPTSTEREDEALRQAINSTLRILRMAERTEFSRYDATLCREMWERLKRVRSGAD